MDSEEEPFVVDRVDNFPKDRAYPSRSTRSQISKRPTDNSLLHDRQLHHPDTGDFEPRKRVHYTIPLRHQSSSAGDEEKGYLEKSPYARAYPTPSHIDQATSRDAATTPPPEFLEIISTKWVPDDEGREIVTLTVKDKGGNRKQDEIRCESRWKHIQSDAMTFGQLYQEVTRTPGLGNDDLALVGRLLDKVKKTSEKKFVHGRYLKPITLVYEGEDPDRSAFDLPEERRVQKTATFVSLPVFTTCCPKRHTSTKEFEGHPVRALLQSRYRLESTKRRDKEQVITKTASIRDQLANENHIVHLPQIWALMINNYTVITCIALDSSVLRGDSIKTMSYTAAQLDEAMWSVRFTDARGKDFHLPLRFCKTWFDLVKQITDRCLYDECSFIRDQLLRGGPVHQLALASDGSLVNAEKWSKLVEETKTEVIHLKHIDNESVSNQLLVTYCDDEGNEVIIDSDSSADSSSSSSSDDDDIDEDDEKEREDGSTSLKSSGVSADEITRGATRLRVLQNKLRDAESKGRGRKAEDLKERKIPALEEQLLELTAASVGLDVRTKEDNRGKSRIIIPGPHSRQLRSGHGPDHDSPMSPTERHRTRPRSRSRSTSRSRLVKRGTAFSSSLYDLSLKATTRGRTSQPWEVHERPHSTSPARHFRTIDYNAIPRARPHIRPHMANTHSLPRISTLPKRSGSRWDLLRSRVRERQLPGLQSSPISPTTDIYYRPSDKQLARSYWDLVRSSVLDGGIHKLRDAESTNKEKGANDRAKASVEASKDNSRRSLNVVTRLSDIPDGSPNGSTNVSPTTMDPSASSLSPKTPDIPTKAISGASHGEKEPIEPKKTLFSKDSLENKPKLKRLVKLAKESKVVPKIATSPAAIEIPSPISAHPATYIPIFLWSSDHKLSESGVSANKIEQLQTGLNAATHNPFSQKSTEDPNQAIPTSKTEELILHAVLAEVHLALKKPKKATPEYAALYEKSVEKAYADVVSLVNSFRKSRNNATDRAAAEKRNVNDSMSHTRRASLAFMGITQRWTESNRSVLSLSAQNDSETIKLEIFDLARTILFAFVPKGYEAVVISKYWGALHGLLMKEHTVLVYVRARLFEVFSLIRSIQMGVRAEDGSKQQRYQIPRALPAAFQHLIMLLVVISDISNWGEYSWIQMRSTFDDCEGLLVEGRKQLLLMIHTDDYRDSSGFQAVDSEALLSLILANLISSMSANGDFQLTEVYAEYTTDIQRIVRDSASVKVYDDIKFLREELDIVKTTLLQQENTLREFKSTITVTYGVASLSLSILDRILESISQRIDDFDELQVQAETARFLAAQSISLKAESNNKAIIVFTVVTIVFLPLSFVTSYLGMNTSDLRNMKSGQTLFWAIGAPVAFVVLRAAVMAAFYGTLTQRVLGRAWRGKEKEG